MTSIMVDFVLAFLAIGVLSFAVGVVLDKLPRDCEYALEATHQFKENPKVCIDDQHPQEKNWAALTDPSRMTWEASYALLGSQSAKTEKNDAICHPVSGRLEA